jgi:Putative porin
MPNQKLNKIYIYVLLLLLYLGSGAVFAQDGLIRGGGNIPGLRGLNNIRQQGTGTTDSFARRTGFEDSITISYRLLDSSRVFRLDTTLNEYRRFPIPAHYMFLSNLGSAARPLIFEPMLKPGWDAGFHAFDIYMFKLEDTRFYNTTRPYSELSYVLGSRTEQMISILHTQNIKPNWNFAFQYKLINAPGSFKGQKSNHNSYRFNSGYESPNKRYHANLVILSNKLQSSENGGITSDTLLKDPDYRNRLLIPTLLGGDAAFGQNFFSSSIQTGNRYKNSSFVLRQQYDIGKSDSLVIDTVIVQLFYPKLRIQHTISINKYDYEYLDQVADNDYYQLNYNVVLPTTSLSIRDRWQEVTNDLSIYQFPDTKNPQQFLRAGISYQALTGEIDAIRKGYYNFSLNGEYRNKTRNQKWDIEANGQFYVNGLNAGDYGVYASLKRFLSKKIGFVELGFQNVNRNPSFVFRGLSSFNWTSGNDLRKENTTHIFASIDNPANGLRLSGHYYLMSNYTYLRNSFYKSEQEGTIFNLLQVTLEKSFKWRRFWHWYTQVTLQQTTANAPLNVPLIFTRNRFTFEGRFFRNLALATGLEVKYHSPYKADGYSPVWGRFYLQNDVTINNKPDIAAFLHFRIKTFTAYIRAENLNSVNFTNGFGFTNNNFGAANYPYPGLLMRFGIYWGFVN